MRRGGAMPAGALLPALVLAASLVGSELLGPQKADEPVPQLEVSSVAGYRARLPCDLRPRQRNEEPLMLFWYKSEREDAPIYTLDGRSKALSQGRQWSSPKVLGDRAKMRVSGQSAELLIDKLAPEDAGLYRCRIDFSNYPTRNHKINLTVIVPPQTPVIYTGARVLAKSLQPLNEDSELTLVCEVTGGWPPPRVTWHWDGRLIDETFVREYDDVTVNRLDLSRVTRDMSSAQLVCKANNTHLVQPSHAEIVVDVNLKPVMVNITNKAQYLSAKKSYGVECVTSGSRPEAVITWWKGTHQVPRMARNFVDELNMTRSVLSFTPTIEDDGKFLTCRAENTVVPDSALEDKWHLVIHNVPEVTIKLGSSLRATDINEGDDVYFECEVKANPRAYKLGWLKNGKELHHSPAANVIMPGGNSLVLQKVNRTSAGEYSCMAANYEGKSTSRPVALDVMYAPLCKDSSTQVVGALKHETISLVCGVQSKPPPTSFQWTFNNSGELMSVPSSRYAQVKPQYLIANNWHGSRLNYTPATDMDYGTVACHATNKIGDQKLPCLFQIIVAGKPYPLQNCSALQSTGPYASRMGHEDFKATDARDADWLIVRCNEGFDGGLPITSFELEVFSDESVYHVNTVYVNHTDKALGPIFEVPGLEPGRNYRLLLYAVNAKGRSDPVVLEPVTLKGVAMYTTGRDSSEDATDYSMLVACFAGGVTALCILVVGVTLTLYRRNHPLHPSKTQTHVVHCTSGSTLDAHATTAASHDDRQQRQQHLIQLTQHVAARQEYELQQRVSEGYAKEPLDPFARLTCSSSLGMSPTRPTTAAAAAVAVGGSQHGYVNQAEEHDPDVIPLGKPERRPDIFEPSYALKPERIKEPSETAGPLVEKDTWLRQNGDHRLVEGGEPDSPTLARAAHDIYTRSLRLQESCI